LIKKVTVKTFKMLQWISDHSALPSKEYYILKYNKIEKLF